jgi:tRNA G10  N-methylase Trm11
MARSKLTILFPHGKHDVCRRMECNESLDQEEESQWYEQCDELVEKLKSYKATIELLSGNNDDQIQQFNQSLKLLKTELEFEEQKLRMLTKSDGVFYEASFIQSKNKTYNFDKCGEGKEVSKREM